MESSAFEFGAVGVYALSIDSTYGAEFTTIEYFLDFVGGGGYDSMNESLMDSILEVADIPMF